MAVPVVRNQNQSSGSTSPIILTLPQPASTNSYLVFIVFGGSNESAVIPTDSASNTWASIGTGQDAVGNTTTIFAAPVTATGSGTLTVTWANLSSKLGFLVEVTGGGATKIDGAVVFKAYPGSGSAAGIGGEYILGASNTLTATDSLILSAYIDQNRVSVGPGPTQKLLYRDIVSFTSDAVAVQSRSSNGPGVYQEAFWAPPSAGMTAVVGTLAIAGTNTRPLVTANPIQVSAAAGGTAALSVTATASGGSNTYQWQTAPITSLYENTPGTWVNVSTGSGGTTATYTTGTLSTADNGTWYRCTITDSNGSTTTIPVRLFLTGLGTTGKGTVYGQFGLTGWFVDRKNSRKDSFGLLRRMRGDSQ